MTPYIEKKHTDKKLMLDMLKQNIKAVDLMAANILNPHEEYPQFEKLIKKIIEGYE